MIASPLPICPTVFAQGDREVAWFRARVRLAKPWRDKELVLWFKHIGAIDVFLDFEFKIGIVHVVVTATTDLENDARIALVSKA